uniref:Uncharacterized protein n=1 Tax=Candidatus Kentrum sp. FM TaxID=2126340 RepID=A0A450SPV4_9GAMM|nr:MAG: hypothetical protein BECKFM1743A_GA0114220_101593 [Candidatus Kentron sp. FM]
MHPSAINPESNKRLSLLQPIHPRSDRLLGRDAVTRHEYYSPLIFENFAPYPRFPSLRTLYSLLESGAASGLFVLAPYQYRAAAYQYGAAPYQYRAAAYQYGAETHPYDPHPYDTQWQWDDLSRMRNHPKRESDWLTRQPGSVARQPAFFALKQSKIARQPGPVTRKPASIQLESIRIEYE